MKRRKWTVLFSICLTAFTVYAALDTFVIANIYQESAAEINLSMFDTEIENASNKTSVDTAASAAGSEEDTGKRGETEETSSSSHKKRPGHSKKSGVETAQDDSESESLSAENTSSEMTYEDDNISIILTEYTVNDTVVYVADVKLSSAQYLKTAFAEDAYGKNITDETSDIAENNNAILAVNGDYYGAQESGYVIRNGVVYRETASDSELLCIYADGSMQIVDQSTVSAQELVDEGVWQAFSFGPALLIDGEISVTEDEETGKAKASNPRTAIGMVDDLHYLFAVSDGRTEKSEGLSLYELASFLQQLGAETAYNLDGGGSSTMIFTEEVVNNPTSNGNNIKERKVSDIVYIG